MEQEYFSATVTEATTKFRQACSECALEPLLFSHPSPGPGGEALHLGVSLKGPGDAPNRLVIISGTHGIEGYAGAAIQTGWLHESGEALPPHCSVLMVHLLNPWGAAWNRRENEDNVDVFRNLIYSEHPSDPDPLFDTVDDALDLRNWNQPDRESSRKALTALLTEYGEDRLVAAIRRGQHHRPGSMTYHGNGPSWSTARLNEVVDTYLQGARCITVLDIHTGFGEFGQGMVMSYDPPGSDKYQRVSHWFSGDIFTPGSDPNIPGHSTRLPFEWMEQRLAGVEVTAAILEFGTFPPEEIGEIFNANHHFHVFGDPLSKEGLFNPSPSDLLNPPPLRLGFTVTGPKTPKRTT